MKYKIGDKVKVITQKEHKLRYFNKIGIIEHIYSCSEFPYDIKFEDYTLNNHYSFAEDEICLKNEENAMPTKDLRMYILVNKDIKINMGKLAGQVGHAVAVYFYRYWTGDIGCGSEIDTYMSNHQKKIILYCTQSKLEELEAKGFITIRDKGWTDLEPNTLTCINLGIIDYLNIPEEFEFIKKMQLVR